MSTQPNLSQMHADAVRARQNSHSPYSKYKVGASILFSNGKTYSGCNIENASYGGTVCDVVVVTDQNPGWPPCGFCRQVIAEFADPQTMIHIGDLKGIQRSLKFTELFPDGFTPEHLHP